MVVEYSSSRSDVHGRRCRIAESRAESRRFRAPVIQVGTSCSGIGSTQFLSRDPVVATTRSPYGYVDENPLNATDPSGQCPWNPTDCPVVRHVTDTVGGAVGGAAGAVGGAVSGAAGAVGSQATSWAGDINEFGNTHVFGFCITGSAGAGLGLTGSGCVAGNFHSFGFTGTLGIGVDLPGGADIGAGPLVSDAHSVDELGGPFQYGGASYGEGATINGEFGSGTLPCGRAVHYAWAGPGLGANIPLPFGGAAWGGESNTWTKAWNF